MTLPVTSGLQLWLDASQITGVANGGTVGTWSDASGNGRDVGTGGGSATYNTSQVNGLPAVTLNSWHGTFSGISNSTGHTVFAVFKLASTASKSTLLSGIFQAFTYWFASGGKMQGLDSDGFAQIATGSASPDTSWHQSNVWLTNASGYGFRLDQATDGSGSTGSGTSNSVGGFGYNQQGSGETFNGQVAEFIYYDRTLTSTEILSVESYLNTRYFILGASAAVPQNFVVT